MSTRPNILLLMADQFRADAMSCSGNWAGTPNLDRIAAMGVRYANAVTASPICVPARVCLASGLYCHNTGLWTNKGYTMPTHWRTWMAAIRDAGYRTSLFGKTHLHRHGGDQDLRDAEPLLRAYGLDDIDETTGPHAASKTRCRMTDRWASKGLYEAHQKDIRKRWAQGLITDPSPLGEEEHYDAYVGRTAADYLRDYDRDQPWFCWVSFGGPHEPWDAPGRYHAMFDPAAMPEALPRVRDMAPRPRGGFDEHCAKYDAMLTRPGKLGLPPGHSRNLRANYAGKVALIDHHVGYILDAIEKRGELDRTVIVFTSDHGEMNGDHGLVYKSTFLDGAARIPLLLSTPAVRRRAAAGRVCPAPTELIDLGPTLVELAGATWDWEQFGISLTPTLQDPAGEHRPDALCEFEGEVMLLNRDWKAVINEEGEIYQLIDRQNDPDEQHNLAGGAELQETRDRLRLRLLQRLSQSHRQIPIAGYIGESGERAKTDAPQPSGLKAVQISHHPV